MAIEKKLFGNHNGQEIYIFVLTNKNGLLAEILNFGGIVRRLVYKGVDVSLGFDTFEEYLNNPEYFGALVGRNANRIANSEFELNGEIYKLTPNCGKDNLHGGIAGFDKKIWDCKMVDEEEPSLVLKLKSPDGEGGFPGNVDIMVTYTLAKDNSIKIHYLGKSDADTVLNMTNHTYFNLNGHANGSVGNHLLWLNSDFYTPNTSACIPNGEILSVKGTPFDFTSKDKVKVNLEDSYEQIQMFGGLDHNFVLNDRGYRKVGEVRGDKTGISMEIYTDRPGVQVYTANDMKGSMTGKEGVLYKKHSGICFETQDFPNNLKIPHFPSSILKKGEKYETTTTYKFI